MVGAAEARLSAPNLPPQELLAGGVEPRFIALGVIGVLNTLRDGVDGEGSSLPLLLAPLESAACALCIAGELVSIPLPLERGLTSGTRPVGSAFGE